MPKSCNDLAPPYDPTVPRSPRDFGALTEAFHMGSLSNFSHRLAKGQSIDAERIAAVKKRNPDWREHEAFRTYCDDFENGRIPGKRGRPRQPRSVRYIVASFEYPIYLKLLQRWRRQRRRSSMLARHYSHLDLSLVNDCHAAAEIVQAKFRLPHAAERFLVKMSEERHPR